MVHRLVVVGLGYVGLPLVQAAAGAGISVTGLDRNAGVCEGLNRGLSHIDDISDDGVRSLLATGFSATDDPRVISKASVVVVCVPTPLTDEGGPDLDAVLAASEDVAANLSQGTLVVLESTTWPGTTEEVVLPILEKSGYTVGKEFLLCFSPERIDPGNAEFGMTNTPKVIGGVTAACAEAGAAFYEQFVETVVRAKGTREAEMAKLLENTYRHVNIALVNEMLKFSHELGVDIWDVIRCASTKPFGFQAFRPGPGVGGHCIPIDPNYLSHRVRAQLGYPFRFVELAQEVNNSMPRYVTSRLADLLNQQGKAVNGSNILLLGVTYKSGIADQRESPAAPLARFLDQAGAAVSYWDPFVSEWSALNPPLKREVDLRRALEDVDIAVHLQHSPAYDPELFTDLSTTVLDTRGVLRGDSVVLL